MPRKKVLLILVEGPSDETSLAEPLVEMLSNNLIHIKIQHGDILTKYKVYSPEFEVTRANVKGVINTIFKEKINNIKKQYKLRNSDFIGVVYCTDIDNCFTSSSPHSKNKKQCLEVLFNEVSLSLPNTKKEIEFRVLFFSKNLEHVLHNKLGNFDDKEKESFSNKFIKLNHGASWFEIFNQIFDDENVMTWQTFTESFEKIRECCADTRATNLNCLIEYYTLNDE